MHADEVAFNGLDRLSPCVRSRFDRGHVAYDNGGDQSVTYLGHGTDKFHVRCLKHSVGAFHQGDQAAGFDESNSLMSHN